MTRKAARRRRQTLTVVASTALGALLPGSASARGFGATPFDQASPAATVYRFSIAAGPLADVLRVFERVTGITVRLGIDAIGTIQSPGVAGSFTIEQALRGLLEGTSIRYRLTSATSAVLELGAASESIEVTGRANAVVSSPKYTQPLRDTPQTLVVIPQTVLHDQASTSLRDALRNTPGITLMAGEGGAAPGDNLLIRGFSGRNDVYIDGARDPGVVSRDTFNTEAIEVAKGPSSVTAGRGSTGGSVNLVTKSAMLQNTADFRFSAGNASQRRATLDVNRRLSDTVAFRVNGMLQDSGVPGRDEVTQKAWGFAPSLSIGIGKPTTATVSYQRADQDNLPDHGLPGTLPDLAVAAGKTVDDLDFSNFYGLRSRDHETMTSDVFTGTVEHRFNEELRVRNLTRYGKNFLDRVVTSPRAASAATSVADPGFDASVAQIRRSDTKYQYRNDKTVTNQTDLNVSFRTGSVLHEAVTGLELAHDRQPGYAAIDVFSNGRPPVTDLFNPDPTQAYSPAIARTGATSEASSQSTALYVFDTVKFHEMVQVDFGARWDRIDVDYHTVSATGVHAQFGRVDRALSGRTGVVFKPVQRGTIYGAYSTSFNPSYDGNFGLTLAATGVNNSALPPERSRNVEVGTKWDLKGTLFATLAYFRTNKTNAKTTDSTTGATVLAGDQQVAGVELGLSGNLTRRLGVFAGLSLMKGEIRESLVTAEIDKRLSYVPEKSFNLWSTYLLPHNVTIGGGAQYTGGYYFTNTNVLASTNAAAIQRLTKYWLFSAMANHRFNPRLGLQVNVNNLANERYVERGYTGHFVPGPGRSILVSPVITF